MSPSVLIVEDERHLAEGVRYNLEAEGFRVEVAETGEAALTLLTQSSFDAVVLDVMLPGMDGFTVAARLRERGQYVPVLMLTALGQPEDVLKGFESGADDYLPKPFERSILIARIRGLLRRRQWLAQQEQPETFHFNGKSVDFHTMELRTGNEVVQLTQMEVNLLRHLIRHEGKPVSRKALLEEVWGLRIDTDTRAIDNFIVRLRRYIEPEPHKPRHLLTVRGVGYRFIANPT
jgi:two-component system, OmpR family, alkaline phosphatase synthesis response regulator PhoP